MTGGPLESSVTLEQVFAVVGTKRVPLAPELAGYLVLEVAENADPNGGDLDPKSVYVSEEGIVALVKPKREAAVGDAETSIRAALARLLEASGSQTPALAAASKRKNGGGLAALAEELEAALIPVNRAAGRRALARLAREVKRVALGVGRNALPSTPSADPGPPPSRRPSSPAIAAPPQPQQPAVPALAGQALPPVEEAPPPPSPRLPPAPPPPSPPTPRPPSAASFTPQEEPTTARGQIPEEVLRKATPEPGRVSLSELPTMEFEPAGRTPSPSQTDVDELISDFSVSGTGEQQHARDLKKMAGLSPTPPPPEIARRMETRQVTVSPLAGGAGPGGDTDVESLLALGDEPASGRVGDEAQSKKSGAAPSATSGAVRAAPAPVLAVPNSDERQLPTQPSKLKQNRASLPSVPRMKSSRGGWVVVVLAVAAIAAGAYAITLLPRGGASARQDPQSPTGSAASPGPASSTCIQTLVLSDVPPHAEVLVRKGQAPVDVERMPVGARLEFVATAEGFAPKRVVVPAGAAWDPGSDGKPRYEAAVQLDKSKAPHGTNDAWPAGEPGSAVGGQGPPGTVHVVATPRGAEIWMLAGLGPDARIEQQQACDEDVDVLLAGPTTYRKRIHVAAADFAPESADEAAKLGAGAPGGQPPMTAGKQPRRVAHVSGK